MSPPVPGPRYEDEAIGQYQGKPNFGFRDVREIVAEAEPGWPEQYNSGQGHDTFMVGWFSSPYNGKGDQCEKEEAGGDGAKDS